MDVKRYEDWVEEERRDYIGTQDDLVTYDIMALQSEAGEIADTWKKRARGDYDNSDEGLDAYREDILLEGGDTLHYLMRTLHDHGYTLQDAIDANVEKLTNRAIFGKGNHGKRS